MKHVPPLNCETSFHVSSKTVYLEVTKVCAACLSCLSYPGKGREEPKRLRERVRLRSHCNRVSSLLSSAIWVSRSLPSVVLPLHLCVLSREKIENFRDEQLRRFSHQRYLLFVMQFSFCLFFFKYYFFKYYF